MPDLRGIELSEATAIALGWEDVERSKDYYSHAPKLLGIAPDTIPSRHTGYRGKIAVPEFSCDLNSAFASLSHFKHLNPVVLYDSESLSWRCAFNSGMDGNDCQGQGETPAEAICRTLLLAFESGYKPIRVNQMGQTY